jgi:hypothetical protein
MKPEEILKAFLPFVIILCLIWSPAHGCCLPDFSSMDVTVSVNVTFPPTMPQQWNMKVFTKAR